MTKFQENAKRYIDRNWSVLPIETWGKKPHKGYPWSKESLKSEQLENFPSTCNTGVILGDRSNGIIDIDCDIPEAAAIAKNLLGNLPSFGRKSSPYSHFIANCPDPGKTIQYGLTKDQAKVLGLEDSMIIELRGNGGQTVFPGSTHHTGEVIEWHTPLPDELPSIQWAELQKRTSLCAFASVILKAYPAQEGTRDNICLALAGALLRADLTPDEANDLIVYIAEAKGDEEAQDRAKAHSSQERLDNGEDVTGLPALCKLLGIEALEKTLSKWLYGPSPKPTIDADDKIAELNKTFFVVGNEGAKCRVAFFEKRYFGRGKHREVLVFQSFEDFRNRFMNQLVITGFTDDGKPITRPLGKYWLEHPDRRQYDRIEFAPGRETPPNVFNLWRGFAFEAVEGSWDCMNAHVKRILANNDTEAYDYIIKWAAWAVQNPSEPAEVALVFRGGKGTGKGTFCRALTLMFGDHGLHVASSTRITGTFNAHLRDCILLFADEAVAPNDKNAENVMKGLVTEPTITIEGKGRDVIQARNQLHIVMASNDRWVVPASADERRFAVFDISDEMAGREDWFAPLNAEIDNGGLEAMLHFFLNMDLGDWHPRKNIPNNQALNDQRIESLKGLEKLWFDYISTGEAKGFSKGNGIAISTEFFAQQAGKKISNKAAGMFLKKMGCTHDRNTRPTSWITPPLAEAREIWDRELFPVPWDEEANWLPVPPDDPPF